MKVNVDCYTPHPPKIFLSLFYFATQIKHLFALLFIYTLSIRLHFYSSIHSIFWCRKGEPFYLVRSVKSIMEINGFLRLQPDCSNAIHPHHPSWIYSTPTYSKWWGGSQRLIKYDPVKACNLVRVGKNSHSVGTQTSMQFSAKIQDTKRNCFKNSEKELEKNDSSLEQARLEWVLNES